MRWFFMARAWHVPTAGQRNALYLSENEMLDQPAPVAAALPATRAGFGTARRVWAIPGPEATLNGVAYVLERRLLVRVPGWVPLELYDLPRLAAALFRLARRIDTGAPQPLLEAAAAQHWLIGTLLPLPVWQPDGGPVQVDTAAIVAAMGAVPPQGAAPAAAEWTVARATPARPLDQFDPFRVTQPFTGGTAAILHAKAETAHIRGLVTAASTAPLATALGTEWGAKARWNPYAALFPILSIMHEYARPPNAALAEAFATAFLGAFTRQELAGLEATSAGYAILRSLWRAAAACRNHAHVGALIGAAPANTELAASYPTSPGALEPPVADGVPEPPLPTPASRDGSAAPRMGFGRIVPFKVADYPESSPRYHGLSWPGTIPVLELLRDATPTSVDGVETVFQPANARDAWGRIVAAIATTEGRTDASSSWDSGIASLGFQQWSMHAPENGPSLLSRLKRVSPVIFDAVVRSAHIDGSRGAALAGDTGSPVADCMAHCHVWRLYSDGRPPEDLREGPNGDRKPILGGFGWIQAGDHWSVGPQAAWLVSRWSTAARFLVPIWQAEAEMGFARVPKVRNDLRGWEAQILAAVPNLPRVGTVAQNRAATLLELLATEAMAASILDHDVNRPTDVRKAIVDALKQAIVGAVMAGATSPLLLDDLFRVRLLVTHQGTRQLNNRGGVIDIAPSRVGRLARDSWERYVSLTNVFPWPP